VPLEESLGALIELREAGKVRAIGICNVDCDQLEAARAVTEIASVAWLLARSPVCVPLPGTTDPGFFEEDLAALAIGLSADEVAALER
jgi:aryl-alcohol dehydrogenase-like predicted oxidoreductase